MSKVVAQSTPAWLSGWRQCWRRYPDCQVFLALFGKARSAQMQKFCSNRSAAGQNRVHRLRSFLSHRPCEVCVRTAKPVNPENLTRNICSLNNSRKQISGKDYCPRSNQQPSTPRNTRYRHPPTSMQLSDGYGDHRQLARAPLARERCQGDGLARNQLLMNPLEGHPIPLPVTILLVSLASPKLPRA